MLRTFRYFLLLLMALLALIITGLGLMVLLVDPNNYKDELRTVVRTQTGMELTLDGELGWSFYPVLGFRVQNAGWSLRNDSPQLMQVDALSVGLRLLPLLSKRIEVDGLDISGLHLNLVVNERGQNNWMPVTSAANQSGGISSTAQGLNQSESVAPLPAFYIPRIQLRDSQLNYEDQQTKQNYTVEVSELELRDVSLQDAFPLQLKARLRDKTGLDVDLALSTQLRIEGAGKKITADALDLQATLKGIFQSPLQTAIRGRVDYDQNADQLDATVTRLQFANVIATTELHATSVSQALQFKGRLQTEVFNLKTLLHTLGITPPITQDDAALSRVQADLTFSGDTKQVKIKPLTLKIDDSTLNGDVAVIDRAKQFLSFSLTLDHMDVDRYLSPVVPEKGTQQLASTAPSTAKPLIPVETLRALKVKGSFSAKELIVNKIAVHDLNLSLDANAGDVQVSSLTAKVWQGTLSGSAGLDVRGAEPQLRTDIDVQNVELQDVLQTFTPNTVLSGRSALKLQARTHGNDVDTLTRQALGQLDLNVNDGLLHGVNLNKMAGEALTQKLGSATQLVPDYQQRLPKVMKEDTQLRKLLANMKIENGHLIMPDFKAETDAGQINAQGDIDMLQQAFDYRFGVVLASLADNKYFKGTQWPVRCQGKLSTAVSTWCRPDSQAIGDIVQKAATIAMRVKATEKLGEKLGIQNADEAAVKQEAKQKAKEKVNEELGKQFNKLLQRK